MNSDTITDKKKILDLLKRENPADLAAILEKADPALKSNGEVISTAMWRDLALLKWADASLKKDKGFLLANLMIRFSQGNGHVFANPEEIEEFREKIKIACAQFCRALDCVASEIKSDRKWILNLLTKNFRQFPSYINGASIGALKSYFSSKIKEILDHIDPGLKKNEGFLLEMLAKDPSMFFCAADELKKSRVFLRKALKEYPKVIGFVDPELQNDQTFLLEIIQENARIFDYIPLDLKSNKAFSSKALERNAGTFPFIVDEEQRKDKKLISKVIKKCPEAIRNAADVLQRDEDFLLSLIQENPKVLLYVKPDLYSNHIFVLKAVTKNGLALECARSSMRSDPEMIEAAKSHPEIIQAAILNALQRDSAIQHPPILTNPLVPPEPLSNQHSSKTMPLVSDKEKVPSPSDQAQPSALPEATLLPQTDHPKSMPDDLIEPPEQPGKALPSVANAIPPVAKAIPPVTKAFSWVVIGVIGLVLGTGLGLCGWLLGYSLGLSLGILAPLCCLGALAIHWLLSKKEVHSDPDIRKNASASQATSQDSTADKNRKQPSAQIFSGGVPAETNEQPHQSPGARL